MREIRWVLILPSGIWTNGSLDVLIIEDDPYTMLQFQPYSSDPGSCHTLSVENFTKTMVKSFLHHDFEGRVIRLETFSKVGLTEGLELTYKTICPGARLGWFACNSMFAERLLRGTEVQTQHPSGFSQVN
jgi:aromatic amino acid aminotransferase I